MSNKFLFNTEILIRSLLHRIDNFRIISIAWHELHHNLNLEFLLQINRASLTIDFELIKIILSESSGYIFHSTALFGQAQPFSYRVATNPLSTKTLCCV